MSVLVEALTLVVPKHVLAVSYPGGVEAYAEALLALQQPPRYICTADPEFLNASFYDPDHITPATDLLEQHGVVPVDDDTFLEFAIVDQRHGPTLPCAWLEWRTHRDGFTYAWRSGQEPGDMAAPEGWTPEQSRGLTRTDIRDDADRMFQLAADDHTETWLDFGTGAVIRGPAEPRETSTSVTEADPDDEGGAFVLGTLQGVIREAVEANGWAAESPNPATLTMSLREDHATYDVRFITMDGSGLVVCFCVFPVRVPAARRIAIAEAITRLNWECVIGAFDLDFSDGELRYRIGIDVEKGALTPGMVHDMIGWAITRCEQHHDDLMRVAFGGAAPESPSGGDLFS